MDGAQVRSGAEGGWRRFDGDRRGVDRPVATPPSRTESPRGETMRSAPPTPRTETPRFAPRSESPRYTPRVEQAPRVEATPRSMAPPPSRRVEVGGPIVRERSSGHGSEARSSGGYGRGDSRGASPGGRR